MAAPGKAPPDQKPEDSASKEQTQYQKHSSAQTTLQASAHPRAWPVYVNHARWCCVCAAANTNSLIKPDGDRQDYCHAYRRDEARDGNLEKLEKFCGHEACSACEPLSRANEKRKATWYGWW